MAKHEDYEDYEIDSDVDTLMKANELLADDYKLTKIKKRFAEKQKALDETAKQLNIEKNTQGKLDKMYGKKDYAKENKKTD